MINHEKNFFYIGESIENKKAFIEYALEDSTMIIESTEVDKSLQGQGIAKTLLDEAVAYARANQLKIIPKCSYVKHKFENDTSYQDVWAK